MTSVAAGFGLYGGAYTAQCVVQKVEMVVKPKPDPVEPTPDPRAAILKNLIAYHQFQQRENDGHLAYDDIVRIIQTA